MEWIMFHAISLGALNSLNRLSNVTTVRPIRYPRSPAPDSIARATSSLGLIGLVLRLLTASSCQNLLFNNNTLRNYKIKIYCLIVNLTMGRTIGKPLDDLEEWSNDMTYSWKDYATHIWSMTSGNK